MSGPIHELMARVAELSTELGAAREALLASAARAPRPREAPPSVAEDRIVRRRRRHTKQATKEKTRKKKNKKTSSAPFKKKKEEEGKAPATATASPLHHHATPSASASSIPNECSTWPVLPATQHARSRTNTFTPSTVLTPPAAIEQRTVERIVDSSLPDKDPFVFARSRAAPRTALHRATSRASPSIPDAPDGEDNRATGRSLLKGRRVIIVANRLPVTIQKRGEIEEDGVAKPAVEFTMKRSAGGLISAMAGLEGIDLLWIGWPGIALEDEPTQNIVREQLKTMPGPQLVPVFIPQEMQDLYYNSFSNDVLWPTLHYVPVGIDRISSATKAYEAYRAANRLFALEVMRHYRPGVDIVWVQDYHLFLLPAMLRKMVPDVLCGVFLHTPFPSSEIVRVLPWREDLLGGFLAADLIGFHTHDFARHFRSACSMILGHRCTADGIDVGGHWFASVGVFPIGIDPDRFKETLASDSCRRHVLELQSQFQGKRIILGVDRLDYTKGIPHKLLAYEEFLENNPDMRDEVVLVQIAVPSRTGVREYQLLAANCHELVGRINGRYGSLSHTPIQFLDTAVAFPLLCALYSISACCFITSVRDGMNLVAFEFLTCQVDRPVEESGVLILSEFTGAAQSLGAGAIRINPWNIHDGALAIRYALTLSEAERRLLRKSAWEYVREHTAQRWSEDFLGKLVQSDSTWGKVDAAVRVPRLLHVEGVVEAFRSSRGHRLIVTTLVDTLTTMRKGASRGDAFGRNAVSRVNPIIQNSIDRLASDKSTTLVVISSRSRHVCNRYIGSTRAWIAAENGYFLRVVHRTDEEAEKSLPGTSRGSSSSLSSRPADSWEALFDNVDLSWYEEAMQTCQHFCDRTPSTELEANETSIIWHYSQCADTAFGSEQAKLLVHHLLGGPLSNSATSVTHVHARRLVCVRPAGVTQEFTMERIIAKLESLHGPVSFRLCIGSFFSHDEDIVSGLKFQSHSEEDAKAISPTVISCTVGKKLSRAPFYVASTAEAQDVIISLASTMT